MRAWCDEVAQRPLPVYGIATRKAMKYGVAALLSVINTKCCGIFPSHIPHGQCHLLATVWVKMIPKQASARNRFGDFLPTCLRAERVLPSMMVLSAVLRFWCTPKNSTAALSLGCGMTVCFIYPPEERLPSRGVPKVYGSRFDGDDAAIWHQPDDVCSLTDTRHG
jgi:hypothetical protein